MKQNGIIGLGSGKLGSTISSVRGGVQIQREYRSSIANPSTEGQVAQRARIKLMAQLGAALKAIIAIPPMKLHTSRNLFSKANIGFVEVNDGVASIDYSKIQLTSSSFGCPSVVIARSQNASFHVNLSSDARGCCNAVVYNLVKVNSNDKLQVVDSVVVTDAGEEGLFDYIFPYIDGRIVVYAYGIRLNSAKARAKYAAYRVNNGRDVASLVISRKIASPDFRVTCTVAHVYTPESNYPTISSVNSVPVDNNEVIIDASASSIVLNGANFGEHEWTLSEAPGARPLAEGVIMSQGSEVVFIYSDVGTYYVGCDGETILKITMSPYGCYIRDVNGEEAHVGGNVTLTGSSGLFVIYGTGFFGGWQATKTTAGSQPMDGVVSEDGTMITFSVGSNGYFNITNDGMNVMVVIIQS